jgi:hypothetical protein
VIGARSVDAPLADRLPTDARAGLVHSAHERVVNLLTPDGLLCCLSTASLDDAPRTIRIAESAWPTLAWQPGDRVVFGPGELRHPDPNGETVVVLRDADRWRPTFADLARASVAELRGAVAVIDRAIQVGPARSAFEEASAELVLRRTAALEAAVRDADPAATAAAALDLVGLGAGLTPTGDDILTGLAVTAASRGMRLAAVQPALRSALGGVALDSLTTAVSAATLREAADGRGRQRLHDLLATVATPGAGAYLAAAIQRVLAIGHSSGADILTGVRLGLAVEADLRAAAPLPRPSTTHTKEIR